MSTKHRHASGRWDRSLRLLSNDTERHVEAGARIVTGTEADQEKRERVLREIARKHGYYCQTGDGGTNDDCWALIDKGTFRVVYGANLPVASNRGGPSTRPEAVFLVLEEIATGIRILVTVMHLPHGVGLLDKITTLTKRWRIEARDWHRQALALAKEYGAIGGLMCGDWNVNLRSKRVRKAIAKELPGVRFWPTIPAKGTHKGGRLIDFTVTFGAVRAASPTILPFTSASDHAAYDETVTWTAPKPAPSKPKETPVARLPRTLPDILKSEGLRVVIHPGWETRGRPGSFAPVGVLCHHTATGPKTSDTATVNLLIRGRSDLPGPLAQLGLDRSGRVHIIAAGRANHAGKAKASGTVAAGDGNTLYIGIEAFNDGRGEPWPRVQYDAYVKLCAALSKRITGNSANTVRGHKETSVTGKIDPRFDMDKFRAAVRARISTGSTSTSQKDWFDMATKKDLQDAIREMKFDVIGAGGKTRQWTLGQFLHNIENDQDSGNQRINQINAKLDQVLAALKKGGK